MSPEENSTEEKFLQIVKRMRENSHGCKELGELSNLLRGLKKRKKNFIAGRFVRRSISWDENKEKGVWEDEAQADKNRYWFLQGSIIQSSHVIGPSGIAKHQNWLVLSPDCDCTRAEYIVVGKIRELGESDNDKDILGLATALKTHKFFPIPPHGNTEHWGVVEMETPYFLERANYAAMTRTSHWLSSEAWHILNGVLQLKHTRALNMSESEVLRTDKS